MKASVVASPGKVPQYTDVPDPAVAEGHELVDLVAAGLHPIVRGLASGGHYGSSGTWPMVPGLDAVARRGDGTLVYTGGVTPPDGTFAERMSVPTAFRFPLPEGADPAQVAGGMNPGMASWMPLVSRRGELGGRGLGTVLVLGATGVAGDLAVQNAGVLGATAVVAVGRDRTRLARVDRAGVRTVALVGDHDADAAAIAEALGGTAPSTVLDFVWGPVAEAVFAAMSRHGLEEDTADVLHVEIGAAAGATAALPAALLRSRHYRVQGSGAGSASVRGLLGELPRYIDLLASGQVVAPVRTMPLSRVAEAWHTGSGERIVLTV